MSTKDDADSVFGWFTISIIIVLMVTIGDCSCSCGGCSIGKGTRQVRELDTKINTVSSNLVELKNYLDTAHGQIVKSNSRVNSK